MLNYRKVSNTIIVVNNGEFACWIRKVEGLWCNWGRIDEPVELVHQRFFNCLEQGNGGLDMVYDLYEPFDY